MPWIAVSPVTGHIRVIFYSRRDDAQNNSDIRVYDAGSTDAGMTWFNQPRSTIPFTPSAGYDISAKPRYMGDYISVVAAGSNFYAAWGDTRNQCTPPPGAPGPARQRAAAIRMCSSPPTPIRMGADLAITPWGSVTGQGPAWQSPDIFVVDSANNVVNAKQGIVNSLRARIRNLGNAAANGATVRIRLRSVLHRPHGCGLQGDRRANGQLCRGGRCIRKRSDRGSGAVGLDESCRGQWRYLAGADQLLRALLRQGWCRTSRRHQSEQQRRAEQLRRCHQGLLPPAASIPDRKSARTRHQGPLGDRPPPEGLQRNSSTPGARTRNALSLQPKEIRVATAQFVRPAEFAKERRTSDVVASISMQVDNQQIGGLSVRLADANVRVSAPA